MKDSFSRRIRTALLAGTAGLALTFGTACTDDNGVEVENDGVVEDQGAEVENSSDGLVEEDRGPEFGNDDGTGTFEDEPGTGGGG
jgi:hypothetical protein